MYPANPDFTRFTLFFRGFLPKKVANDYLLGLAQVQMNDITTRNWQVMLDLVQNDIYKNVLKSAKLFQTPTHVSLMLLSLMRLLVLRCI